MSASRGLELGSAVAGRTLEVFDPLSWSVSLDPLGPAVQAIEIVGCPGLGDDSTSLGFGGVALGDVRVEGEVHGGGSKVGIKDPLVIEISDD